MDYVWNEPEGTLRGVRAGGCLPGGGPAAFIWGSKGSREEARTDPGSRFQLLRTCWGA